MPDTRFMTEQRLAYILLAIAPALFASNMLTARLVHDLVPPVGLAFWRWAVTFLLLLPLVGPQLWRQRREALTEWKDLLVLCALGLELGLEARLRAGEPLLGERAEEGDEWPIES